MQRMLRVLLIAGGRNREMEGCRGASFNGGLDHRPNALRVTRSFDTELSIFDAERYFSEGNVAPHRTAMLDLAAERCVLSTNLGDSLISSVDGCGQSGRSGRSGSHQSTPTASSEASWNSKSCLLSQPPDSVAVAVRALPPKDPRKFGTLRLFDGSCLCSSKKSVEVEATLVGTIRPINSHMDSNASVREGKVELSRLRERAAADELTSKFDVEEMTKVKLTPGNWGEDRTCFNVTNRFPPEKTFPAGTGRRIVNSRRPFMMESFSFPVLNPPSSNLDEEAARHSLEIFRDKETVSVVKKSVEIQRGTVVLENPRERSYPSFIYPAIPKSRPEDDAASDASSDLFEIESLSTLITCRRREVLDDIERMRFAGIKTPRLSLEGSEEPSSAAPSVAIMDLQTTASNYDESRFSEADSEQLAPSIGGALSSRSRDEKAVSFVFVPPSESNSLPRIAGLASVNLVQSKPNARFSN